MRNKLITIAVGMLTLLSAHFVFAQSYDIKTMTPEIQAALENRRTRFGEIVDLKRQGIIGENNKGYVEILIESAKAEQLVVAENSDREIIYKAIAEQNGLTGALSTIESVFAQVQRDKAQAGDRIQLEDGQWVSK